MSDTPGQKKRALGRGLGALIPRKSDPATPPADPSASGEGATPGTMELPLSRIDPMPNQPRRDIGEDSLAELSQSIREQGVLQPIMVRPVGDRYQIILGERRYRASLLAGRETIPVIVREADEQRAFVMAVVENLQREDLNPVEIARALLRLRTQYAMTQKQISEFLGKPRSTLANYERLLDLPETIRILLEKGALSFGHAKVLCSFGERHWALLDAVKLASGGYSVRELEALLASDPQGKSEAKTSKLEDPQIKALRQMIQRQLNGMPVDLVHKEDGKGRLVIHYKTLDEFDFLMERMGFRVK